MSLSALVGCSVYPIPDDVTPLKTEEIVRHGRCEMRAAVIDKITEDKERIKRILQIPLIRDGVAAKLKEKNITSPDRDDVIVALVRVIVKIVKDAQDYNKEKYQEILNRARSPRDLRKKLEALQQELDKKLGEAKELRKYLDVAVVYDFEFEITEQNTTSGGAAFKLPLVSQTIDADASAALLLTRKGKRSFKAQDRWSGLITQGERCKNFSLASQNLLYPLGGSIGVDRVVTSFVDLMYQGGSKDSFVDTLIFTTEARGGINATIKLSPVPHAFRLVSAGAQVSGSRLDVHKLTLSLVFPKDASPETVFGADRFDGDLESPFDRPADWRARYNLCVADARGREEALKQLRLSAPEIYCITYADAFDAKYPAPKTISGEADGRDKARYRYDRAPPKAPPFAPRKRLDSY